MISDEGDDKRNRFRFSLAKTVRPSVGLHHHHGSSVAEMCR